MSRALVPLTTPASIRRHSRIARACTWSCALVLSAHLQATAVSAAPRVPIVSAQPGSDACWDERFAGSGGTNGFVDALALDGSGNVYAGGEFTSAGGTPVAHVARWDGLQWSALTTGIDGPVYALVAGGGYVYAGGNFTTAGGVSASHIARWDGVSWSAVGSGTNGNVYALALDASGKLYAGGSFTTAGGTSANCIAKWDGTSWTALGAGMGTDGTVPPGVSAILVDDSNNDLVYVGGSFGTADGLPVGYIARWNAGSSTWSAMSSGMNGYVYTLAMSGSDLYAAGGFTVASGSGANNIARWNVNTSSAWAPLGAGLDSHAGIAALAVDGAGRVYAGGQIFAAGGHPASNIAMWTGTDWLTLGTGLNNVTSDLVVDGSGNLFAGGQFSTAGGKPSLHFAYLIPGCVTGPGYCWDERFADAGGTDNAVDALAVDVAGNVYAGGDFTTAGGASFSHIAKWDGAHWSSLGTGINGSVYALVAGGGYVYAGGNFSTAGGVSANHIARWDGVNWSALDTGTDGNVFALALDPAGNLYVGGSFANAGGTSASSIAKWNGTTWTALGTGMGTDGTVPPGVSAILVDDNNSDLVYASGSFGTAGGLTVGYVARWDAGSSTWSAMGSGMNGYVYALAMSGNNLYGAGGFTVASGSPANNVAKWDLSAPGTWTPLGAGLSSYAGIGALTTDAAGRLFAGGEILAAGGEPANHFAMWTGTDWGTIGAGMNDNVHDLVVDGGGDLYAGGAFTTAAGKPANHFAHLFTSCLVGVDAAIPIERTLEIASVRPNPTRQWASIRFGLPAAGQVRVDVFDVTGRRVASPLEGEFLPAGQHQVTWDGRDASGHRAISGMYFVRISTNGAVGSRTVVMIR